MAGKSDSSSESDGPAAGLPLCSAVGCRLPCRGILASGRIVILREIRRGDRELIKDGFAHLSDRSVFLRFMSTRAHLSETEIAQIINDKDQDHVAIGALAEENGTFFLPVGLARFVRLSPGGTRAEAAVTVVDDFQGQGAGRLLIDALAAHARRNGIEVLTGIVHAENHAMLHLLRSYDGLREHLSYGEVEFEIPLSETSG